MPTRAAAAAAAAATTTATASSSEHRTSADADGDLFLGLDFGTSGARATVVDASGDVVVETTAKYPPIVDGGKGGDGVPEGGWANAWETALWSILDGLPKAVADAVVAVAVDGTSGTVLIVDADTGESLYPPMLYNEKRDDAVEAIKKIAPEGHTTRSASSALAKLHSWHARSVAENVDVANARLLHHADWIAFLLHGEMGVTDHNNALKLGFDPGLDPGPTEGVCAYGAPCDGAYPDWLLATPYAYALPRTVLPPGTTCGAVSSTEGKKRLGHPGGVKVVAGTTDSIAAFVAARCVDVGDAVTSLGSSLAMKMVSETRVDDDTKGIYSHRLCGCWLVGGSSNLGGWLLRSNFTNDEVAALTEAMEATTTTANEIPEYFPGVLLGFGLTVEEATAALTPRPDDDIDFLRAILTSIANVEARSYAELYKLGASHEVRRVFTAGGGAKNEKWSTIRSDALGGVPVTASPYAEAAYGSALLARMGHYELASYVPEMCADPTAVCEVR